MRLPRPSGFQFLMEASFISFSGGTVGVIISSLTSIIIFYLSGLPFTVSPTGHILSFIAFVGVGILAGIYPSQKATKIQPADVIRMYLFYTQFSF